MCRLKRIVLFLLIVSYHLTYCQLYEPIADKSKLRENLSILASDEFMGRETASEGERMAAEVIVKELSEYGIKPFGQDDSYLQPFDVYINGIEYLSDFSVTDQTNTEHKLTLGDDYLIYPPSYVPLEFSTAGCELIFAGYGIEAKEYDYNDYAEIDVSGKVAVILAGEPESKDDKFFDGSYRTEYCDMTSKLRTAQKYGALALIIIPDRDEMESFIYKYRRVTRKNYSLENKSGNMFKTEILPGFLLNLSGAQKLLMNKVNSLVQITDRKIIERLFSAREFPLSINAKYTLREINEVRTANNIIGILPGTDASLDDEIVGIGAHYDHDGIKFGKIYNGADDNASGTVAVLETARLLSLNKQNRRPVVFLFHTGEERGLLGSKKLSTEGDFVEDMIAYINLDMIGREDENSIYSIGSDRISLEFHQIIENVNEETVDITFDYSFDVPGDPNRYYYRSDHYNYAKIGIPIVFFYDHMTIDYHKPGDDAEKINYDKVAKITDLAYNIILRVANLDNTLNIN